METWPWKIKATKQRRKTRPLNKSRTQLQPSNLLTIFLYGMLIAGAGALILVLSLWLRERVYSGNLLALGKSKARSSTVLFRGSVGISRSFVILYRWNAILSAPNCTSRRSGNPGHQSKRSINQSPNLCLSSFDWLLVCSPFVLLFRKSSCCTSIIILVNNFWKKMASNLKAVE